MIDRRPCVLGSLGDKARNQDRECVRHGPFDVWRTSEGCVLISDLGGPYDGVKDCYALGISLEEAAKIARMQAQFFHAKVVTTERKCTKCGTRFWSRARPLDSKPRGRGANYFCASCLEFTPQVELDKYWKGVGSKQGEPDVNLSEWCG